MASPARYSLPADSALWTPGPAGASEQFFAESLDCQTVASDAVSWAPSIAWPGLQYRTADTPLLARLLRDGLTLLVHETVTSAAAKGKPAASTTRLMGTAHLPVAALRDGRKVDLCVPLQGPDGVVMGSKVPTPRQTADGQVVQEAASPSKGRSPAIPLQVLHSD